MDEKDGKEPFEEHEQTKTGGEATSAGGGMPPAAALDGSSLVFVEEVDRHTTSRPSTEESSIATFLTLQKMKAKMQQMENEIEGVIRKHQMQQQEGRIPMVLSSTSTEETFEEDGGIEKLEEGNGRKWFYNLGSKSLSSIQKEHASVWEKKETASANIEHSANEIIFLTRGEVDRMKRTVEEQARSIEEMKKEQVTTTGKFEELRSLVVRNPSAAITSNQTSNIDIDHVQAPGGHHRRQSQRMRRSMFGRMSSAIIFESHESIYLDWDTFSLMMISPVCSKSWILGFSSFSCQMTLGVMILIGQFKESEDSSIFGVPFKVDDPSVRVAQFLSIILCLSTQSDILTSIRSFLLLGKGSNWSEVIGEEDRQAACCLWITRVGLPNTFKLSQGLVVTFASFVIIVQNKDTIDLLKDIVSLTVVSEFDNILFNVAAYGYLGEELQQQTEKITDADPIRSTSTSRNRERKNRFLYVRLAFIAILSVMFAGWGIVFGMQRQGKIFDAQFPECGKEHYELAFEEFGDEKCYGGPFNNIKCKYEDGDCNNFNTAFPSCNGEDLASLINVEDEVGNGVCNMTFAIEQCRYDGGDCCPYDVHQSVLFGDGKCNGGLYNTEGCQFDFGDCDAFNRNFPNCTLSDDELQSESSAGIILGDGICDGGRYNTEECGFEHGDCVKGQLGGDIMLTGVLSPTTNEINFEMWMSTDDGSKNKLLVEMPKTNDLGNYDSATNGKIAGYWYNSTTLMWIQEERMDTDRLRNQGIIPDEIHRMAMAGDGSTIVVGSPFYNDNGHGRVTIMDFWGVRNRQVLTGKEAFDQFGWQVDMTDDGTRIAVSSPFSNANGIFSYSGKIEIFQKNEDSSEELWTQVGNDIIGKRTDDSIGRYYVGLNSSDGTRVYFSAGDYLDNGPYQLRTYQINSASQEWVELATDTPILLRPYFGQKELITVSANGNRFAVSSFNSNTTDTPGNVTIYDWTSNATNGGSWIQLGPPLSSPSNENGFGYSISMDASGTLLAISAVDPNCDGLSRFEEDQFGDRKYGTPIDLCATGSIQLYKYKPTNPPWRPFTRLPQYSDINSRRIMETPQQERDKTILGLQVSLSGDGSVLTVSGYDIDGDFGFVKVFHLKDLFYVDCLVNYPGEIGNGKCYFFGAEPYYTEECGYDGGDCPLPSPVEGLDDCKVALPSRIGDGGCYPFLPYSSEACNYDGGDCPLPSPVEGYPDCFVTYTWSISDGYCHDRLPYNSYECGFDGGDCRPAEFTPTSSPSESIHPSAIPSTSPSTSPSISLSRSPSLSPSISAEPSISTWPTTASAVVTFELLTDTYPGETSWFLVDNSQDDIIVHLGPVVEGTYDAEFVYNFAWTLDRCNSYNLTIYDSYGDGFGISAYAELKVEERGVINTLGRIDGDFGRESSISFSVCDIQPDN